MEGPEVLEPSEVVGMLIVVVDSTGTVEEIGCSDTIVGSERERQQSLSINNAIYNMRVQIGTCIQQRRNTDN